MSASASCLILLLIASIWQISLGSPILPSGPLNSKHLKQLGSGKFGSTMLSPKPSVLKIPHRSIRKETEFRRDNYMSPNKEKAALERSGNLISAFPFYIDEEEFEGLEMKFYKGTTLYQLIEQGIITSGDQLDIYQKATDLQVDLLHNKFKIAHGDIHESNILFETVNGQVVAHLIDFGLAKMLDDPEWTKSDAMDLIYVDKISVRKMFFDAYIYLKTQTLRQ